MVVGLELQKKLLKIVFVTIVLNILFVLADEITIMFHEKTSSLYARQILTQSQINKSVECT